MNKIFLAGVISLAVQGRLEIVCTKKCGPSGAWGSWHKFINKRKAGKPAFEDEIFLEELLFKNGDELKMDIMRHFKDMVYDYYDYVCNKYMDMYVRRCNVVGVLNSWGALYFSGFCIVCLFLLKSYVLAFLALYLFVVLRSRTDVTLRDEAIKLKQEMNNFLFYLSKQNDSCFGVYKPPAHSVDLFEKYLPYAVAFDVALGWGEKFRTTLQDYAPVWYKGHFSFNDEPGTVGVVESVGRHLFLSIGMTGVRDISSDSSDASYVEPVPDDNVGDLTKTDSGSSSDSVK